MPDGLRDGPRAADFIWALHSHLPYVLNHGRWPHGSDWITEAAIDTYLPLLEVLRALRTEGVPAPLSIGFTPVLANQLAHATFAYELERYFDQRLEHCADAPAALQASGETELLPLVDFWRARLTRLRALFRAIDRDLPRAFRELEREGVLEIMGSAATHGFLPLLARDESIRLQLLLGRAEHERLFGRAPNGCWVPECAYRPRGAWAPLPDAPGAGALRAGLETFLAEAGFGFFFTDAHLARAGSPLGLYAESHLGVVEHVARPAPAREAEHSPYQAYRVLERAPGAVDVYVRDPRSTAQVWSRHGGYPGDAPYLEFHKIRWPGGLKLWRVSEPGTDLGAKLPYEPGAARQRVGDHARHFVALLDDIARTHAEPEALAIVAPFDTELFGHWWFEGVDFIGDVLRVLHGGTERVRAVTGTAHLAEHPPTQGLRLARGSWGANGDFSMWLNPRTEWTWPRIWALETAFWDAAPELLRRPEAHVALAQAARELLLLQSSDWQFIISTNEVADYAVRRFNGHAADTERLLAALRRGLEGGTFEEATALATALRARDDLFPDVIPYIEQSLGRSPVPVTV